MSRILVASSPQSGHVNPATGIVRRLVERGHEVGWYNGRRYQSKVEALGARFFPMQAAPDYDENDLNATFPGRAGLTGLAQLKWDLKHFFIDSAVGQQADLAAVLREFPADVLLTEPTILGAGFLREQSGPPWAVYGLTQLTLISPDAPPPGLGLVPDTSAWCRLRNRLLNWLAQKVLFAGVSAHLNRVRAGLGLGPARSFVFDIPILEPQLYVQGSTPIFEYPRRNLPDHVHFVGPLLAAPPQHYTRPNWWGELTSGHPVVLVTQGVIALNYNHLLRPAFEALAGEDVLVVATAGGKPVESTGLTNLPANVRLERFIPYQYLMPHVSVMITNGGYGGTQTALAHGVPLVMAGITEGKLDTAAHVAWAGAGINLRTETPTPEQICRATRVVLANPGYRQRARQIQADYARHDGPAETAALLEQLIATRQPVRRTVPAWSAGTQARGMPVVATED